MLEAFTNNTSTMKSKLLSIPRTNLLYLPILMLNQNSTGNANGAGGIELNDQDDEANGMFVVPVGAATETAFSGQTGNNKGVLLGGFIQVDQGLNTQQLVISSH